MPLSRRGRRRLIALAALVIVAAGGYVTYTSLQRAQRERLMTEARQEGMTAYREGRWNDALSPLGRYFSRDKNDLEVTLAFADARFRVPAEDGRHVQEAIAYNRHALGLIAEAEEPGAHAAQRREALDRVLEQYRMVGLRFEVIQTADRILELEPDHVDALAAKASALFAQRQYAEMRPIIDHLMAIQPGDLRWRELYLEMMRREPQSEEAMIAVCDQWSQAPDADGRFLLLKARTLLQVGRRDEANEAVTSAIEQGVQSLDVLQYSITLLDLLGRRDDAARLLADSREAFPDALWVREASLRRLWHAGRIDQALDDLDAVRRDFEDLSPSMKRLEVLLLSMSDREDELRAALEEMLQPYSGETVSDADRAWAEAFLARLDAQPDQWQPVVEAIQQALALQPDDAAMNYRLGEALERQGETALAVEAYRQAFVREPNWVAAGLAYGATLLRNGRIAEALQVSRTVATRSTYDQVMPYVLFVRAFLTADRVGLIDEEERERVDLFTLLETMHLQVPHRADVAALLTEAYFRFGRASTVDSFVQSLLSSDSSEPDVLLAVAAVCRRYDHPRQSALVSRAEQEVGPTVPVAMARAELLGDEGRFNEGLALIDEAISRASAEVARSNEVVEARARFVMRAAQPDEQPIETLRRLVGQSPASPAVMEFVLAQSEAWEDESFVRDVVKRLRDQLGARSPRVKLAEAAQRLRFEPEREASRAKAIILLNEVIEQAPDSLAARLLIADAVLLGDGPDLPLAIEHLEQATEVYPSNADVRTRLIRLLQERGQYDEAERHLRVLSRLAERRPELQDREIELLRAQGDYEAALARVSQRVDPRSSISEQLALAQMYARTGRQREAESIYTHLVERDQPSELAVWQAAGFFARTGRFERGLALLSKLPDDDPQRPRSFFLARFHAQHGRTDEAAALFEDAVRQTPDSAVVALQHANFLHQQGMDDLARAEARRGLDIDPEHDELQTLLAVTMLSGGASQRTAAIEQLRAAASGNDAVLATLDILHQVAVTEDGPQPSPQQLSDLSELVRRYPRYLTGWQIAVEMHAKAGRIDEAIELARRAERRLPGREEPARWAVQLLVGQQRWSEALIEAQEWRRRALHRALDIDLQIARIYRQLDRPSAAVAQLEPHAQTLSRHENRTMDRLGVYISMLALDRQVERARALIEPRLGDDMKWRRLLMAIAADVRPADGVALLGLLSESQLQGDDERLALATAWHTIARQNGDTHAVAEARRHATAIEDSSPRHSPALLLLAGVEETVGNLDAAERVLREALQHTPEDPVALNNLAVILLRRGEHSSEALQYADRALAVLGDHEAVLDTRAQALIQLGQYRPAEQLLDRLMSGDEQSPDVVMTMAALRIEQDRLDEAADAIARARAALDRRDRDDVVLRARLRSLEQRMQRLTSGAGT